MGLQSVKSGTSNSQIPVLWWTLKSQFYDDIWSSKPLFSTNCPKIRSITTKWIDILRNRSTRTDRISYWFPAAKGESPGAIRHSGPRRLLCRRRRVLGVHWMGQRRGPDSMADVTVCGVVVVLSLPSTPPSSVLPPPSPRSAFFVNKILLILLIPSLVFQTLKILG